MTSEEELVSLRKELEETKKIIQTLEHDELTGLYTRQAFLRMAQQTVQENFNSDFGILAIDLENFKSSNTLYGEDKCNEYLSFISGKMLSLLPKNMIGRLGGDQFVILLKEGDDYKSIIKNLEKAVSKNTLIPNQILKFGVYEHLDKELLIVRCCDRAFLAIKGIKGIYGNNVALYEDSLQNQIINEKKIVESMEQGLEQGEFKVFYQPKHDSVTKRIAGAEALVRWYHPVYGFLSPGQFIPLFEKNGFITKLDTFILETVCKDISRWKEEGVPIVPVSVNISRRDYLESGIIENQLDIIDKYKIDHHLIHMEVTESMYSENTELIIKKVRNTQNSGFLIEMDDFGAGYSSLGLLSTFPLDVIKLDISFVKNIEINKIVIENMIKMAHKMGLSTVAEGVETEAQFSILKGLGCDLIQGFYFSKPLSHSDYEAYLRHNSILIQNNVSQKISLFTQDNNEQLLMVANEIAEGIPGGFFSYYAEADLELISFNKEILSIYECDSADEFRELTNNSFKGMVYSEDFDRTQKSIEEQITPENSLDYVEYRIKTKTGKIKYIQDFGRFVKTEKYGDIFYVFVYDITEERRRKEAEEKEQLVKLELEKSAEIAKLSNESKNIVISTMINEVSPLIRELVNGTKEIESNLEKPDVLLKTIRMQNQNVEQMLNFVNNMKAIVSLEQGKIEIVEEPTDISNAAMRIYEIIRKESTQKKVRIECSSEIFNPYIYNDLPHSTDIIFNILRNAIKYTPEGGSIKFGLRQTPGNNENECYVSFYCEDNGIGISKEFLPHVFEPFAREVNPVNEKIAGSGLGLNIAYNILKLMHGTIEIQSEPGKGTIVTTIQPHRFASKKDATKKDTTLREMM